MSKTPTTVVPGLVSFINPLNRADIRHIGTSLSQGELMGMLALDEERFPDPSDTSRLQLQLVPHGSRAQEKFAYSVVEDAESKKQTPRRLDPQEYVDLIFESDLYRLVYLNDDQEWIELTEQDRARPNPDLHPRTPLGWVVKLQVQE